MRNSILNIFHYTFSIFLMGVFWGWWGLHGQEIWGAHIGAPLRLWIFRYVSWQVGLGGRIISGDIRYLLCILHFQLTHKMAETAILLLHPPFNFSNDWLALSAQRVLPSLLRTRLRRSHPHRSRRLLSSRFRIQSQSTRR